MRLTTLRIAGEDRTTAARVDKKHFTLLPPTDVWALIASGPDWAQQPRPTKTNSSPSTPRRRRSPHSPLAEPSAQDPTTRHASRN